MDKRLTLKLLLIIVITALMAWSFYPPSQKLRQGLDLQGGTSLIYAIDTTGLSSQDQKDVAQRLVPILRKRIDPDNIQNLVIRPQGFGRIEIQMPLASKSVQAKRQAYDDAVEAVQARNINIALVERAGTMSAAEREKTIAPLVAGSSAKLKIVNDYMAAFDKLNVLRSQSESLEAKMEKLDKQSADYTALRKQWAEVVNAMTTAGTGANDVYRNARASLEKLNVNVDLVRQTILEQSAGSDDRAKKIAALEELFPERKAQIEALVKTFDEYRKVRGRLDDPEDLRRILKGVGVLEFRILPTTNTLDPAEIAVRTQNLDTYGPARASDEKYVWAAVENQEAQEWGPRSTNITHKFGEKLYVLTSNQQGQVLLQTGGQKQWQLERAYPDRDQNGRRAIGFQLNQPGANLFHRVTSGNIGRPLCILLDNVAISAPNIQSAIFSRGIITGEFSDTQVTDMVNKLNAGSLPARLIDPPITTKTVGPSIGAENRNSAILSGFIGLFVIMVFMAIYYISSGLIADAALCMNVIFILGAMAFSGSTFTLPGIAGLVLTLGMAVDANVLINERIREEQEKGCSVRIAVKNGYDRAFVVIFDSNLTAFLSGLILYMVASEEIKGFAITLMLGIISHMITSIWVTRIVFEWLLQKRVFVDRLRMMHLFGRPNINWMGLLPVFLTISGVVTILGIASFFMRDETKNSKYDIEFTGGTSVTVEFKETVKITREQVEERIHKIAAEENNPKLAAATVVAVGGANSHQFDISTLETNKTMIDVTFPGTAPTDAQAKADIQKAEASRPAWTLTNLAIARKGQTLHFETSQTNSAAVKEVVSAAFAEAKAQVSEPTVNEVVNNAILKAFSGELNVNQDLGPKIVDTQMIDTKMLETEPQLADFYGGVKMTVTLQVPATAPQMEKRFRDLQYKPGMSSLAMNPCEILKSDLAAPGATEELTKFVYVSRMPEAGYRDLTADELKSFQENERTKILQAASLKESLPRVTQIDPSVGSEAKWRAGLAVGLGWIMIIAYIWFRFGRARYGIAGVVALIHDVLVAGCAVVMATYISKTSIGQALLIGDFKINLDTVAAFLTIIGYSINDTIVVFDRIRENRGKTGILTPKLINDSINQTLSRTVLTSVATMMVLLAMYIWGGPGLRGFNYAMMVGVLTGTYSSIAIASPILLLGSKGKEVHA